MSGDGLDAAERSPGHGSAGPRIEDATVGHEESLTGRRLGRYRVGPVVHEGPMSTLYRAHDVGLDRPVALKVIGRELAADPEFRAQFVEEARALSAVDHPHVVPLYDHDEVDGRLFLAMRWVDGTTVRDQAGAGPMPLAQVLALFSQVASALDAVHARGLVHLDVKPANILVSRTEGGAAGHVYLADFGLTRRGFTAGMTSAGQFVGSPAFAAPEHLRGEPVTAAADVYGLGCSLFMALTGRAPYDGSIDQVISGHLTGRCSSPSVARATAQTRPEPGLEVDLAVGPATDAELARAMSADPAARPPSAGALLEGLRLSLAADAPPTPRDGTVREQRPVASVHLGATARRTAAPTAPTSRDPFGARSRHRPEPLLLALLDGRWGRPVELATASVIALLIVLVTALTVL